MLKLTKLRKKINWKGYRSIAFRVPDRINCVHSCYVHTVTRGHYGFRNPDHVKGDYALMLLQCILGLVVMMLPSVIERKWSIGIPNFMYVVYFIFLYCAIYLGRYGTSIM